MQYVLSEEEFRALIPRETHEQIRNDLLDENATLENTINSLKAEVVRGKLCADRGDQSYCDDCRLGIAGLNLCTSNKKKYSK